MCFATGHDATDIGGFLGDVAHDCGRLRETIGISERVPGGDLQ
jgi:hypothetical protein